MKKYTLLLLSLLSCSALSGEPFAHEFFNTNLTARLKRPDLVKEFSEWDITKTKDLDTLFNEELQKGGELSKAYDNYKNHVCNDYTDNITNKSMGLNDCVNFTKANVDSLVDTFRKSIVEKAIPRTIDIQYPEEYIEDAVEKEEEIFIATVDKEEPIAEIIEENIDISDEKIEEILKSFGEVEEESFSERLNVAINDIPISAKEEIKIPMIVNKLLNKRVNEVVSEQELARLNEDLDEYIELKTLEAKPYDCYTWIERQLCNSPFSIIRNYGKKLVKYPYVRHEDRDITRVALSAKINTLQSLYQKDKSYKDQLLNTIDSLNDLR